MLLSFKEETCYILSLTDPCYSSPCMNRGTCTLIAPGGNEDMVQGFWCDCPSDFTGTTCSQPGQPDYIGLTLRPMFFFRTRLMKN